MLASPTNRLTPSMSSFLSHSYTIDFSFPLLNPYYFLLKVEFFESFLKICPFWAFFFYPWYHSLISLFLKLVYVIKWYLHTSIAIFTIGYLYQSNWVTFPVSPSFFSRFFQKAWFWVSKNLRRTQNLDIFFKTCFCQMSWNAF